VDGHDAFVHPLAFYELLVKVTFLSFDNELKLHILSEDGKMLGKSPGIKISITSKRGHSTFVLSAIDLLVVSS